jgi:type II secretory pathway component PulJ
MSRRLGFDRIDRPTRAAFTLIEMLAVILLTSLVITACLNHYVNLSRASQHATKRTAEVRRATAILDRVSRDFQSTLLEARPPGDEALGHPWIFFGEPDHSEVGADRVRFMTRGRRPRPGVGHQSDFEVVTYSLRETENEKSFDLMRWSSQEMPEGPERDTPNDEDDGAQMLAAGLADFSVTFIDEFGLDTDTWDSALIEDSNALPVAVDIRVALFDPDREDLDPILYKRRVVLPIEPLDMEELIDPTSLVSGAPPDGVDDEEIREIPENPNDPNVTPECMDSPCAGLASCAVINCQALLGRHGNSIDTMLELEIEKPRAFCSWKGSQPQSIQRLLIRDPACR